MSVTQSIDSLFQSTAPYRVSAAFGTDDSGNVGFGEANYSGNMSGPLWKPTNEMGKDQFLHLLTTQLKYQDPLSPMENSDFVAQLAQFRALETGENTERAIRDLNDAFAENIGFQILASQSISNSSSMSLIGREVRMRQPTVSWDGKPGTQVPIQVHLGNAHEGELEIRNSKGDVIRTLKVTGKDAQNSATVYWDGMQTNGERAPVGNYLLHVKGSESNPALYPYVQAVVEGVRFSETGVLVKIDGREISMGEVVDVSLSEEGYMTQSSALSLMGKEVRAHRHSIQKTSTPDAEYWMNVNGPANTQIDVEIINSSGKVVAVLREHTNDFGKAELMWNGLTMPGGEEAIAGDYRINVVGSDNNSKLYAYIEGIVDGLTSLTGDFKLKVGGTEVAVGDIITISTPAQSTSKQAA